MKDYDRITAELEAEIDRRFSGSALARHIHSVAGLAAEIAGAIGKEDPLLPRRARVAALAHDLYKKIEHNELREIIRREQFPIDEFAWSIGGHLLHAPAAAGHLRTSYDVRDEQILCAVYYHTTGRAGASLLEKILFCADYLDPSRELRANEPDLSTLSEKVKTDLNGIYREVLRRKLVYTAGKGYHLHPNGIAAWNEVAGNNGSSPGAGKSNL